MFTALKKNLGGHKFKNYRELETGGTRNVLTQVVDWYREGTDKFAARFIKCLNCGGGNEKGESSSFSGHEGL